jgi:hypothetical protein
MSPLRKLSTTYAPSPTSFQGPFSTALRMWTTSSAPATVTCRTDEPPPAEDSAHNLNSPLSWLRYPNHRSPGRWEMRVGGTFP